MDGPNSPPVYVGSIMSADGTPCLMTRYADGSTVLQYIPRERMESVPPGTTLKIPLDECTEALYGPDGTLIASRNEPGS